MLAEVAQQSNVKIIFGHNNRGTRYDFELISRLQRYPYVQMNSKKMCLNILIHLCYEI